MSVITRMKKVWNAFTSRDPTRTVYHGSSYRPDQMRTLIHNDRSFLNRIIDRIAIDCSTIDIRHVRLNENEEYESDIRDSLDDIFSYQANIDQSGRDFVLDAIYSLLEEGHAALVPNETDENPDETDSFKVLSSRVGRIIEWMPEEVRIEVYNELKGEREQVVLPKRYVPIIQNPFYTIMNEYNSTMQRLIRCLSLLDQQNSETYSGKMNLIIQMPYSVRTPSKKKLVDERRAEIEAQLSDNKYGVAWIDSTEHIIQLNRPLENGLVEQVKELKTELLDQLGITMEILNGTANESTMTNYFSRIVEPILTFFVEEVSRKWISKTARTQGQSIRFFRDPFKLVSVTNIGDMADKLRRNEIMTSNEIRSKLGLMPSREERANDLANPNLNQPEGKEETKEVEEFQNL